MSGSDTDGKASAPETAGSPIARLTNGHGTYSPSTSAHTSVPPLRSSPPPLPHPAEEQSLPEAANVADSGDAGDQDADPGNDSEAETIWTSPVKRRELAKIAQHDEENAEESISVSRDFAEVGKPEIKHEDVEAPNAQKVDSGKAGDDDGSGNHPENGGSTKYQDDSDALSDVSSAHSDSESEGSDSGSSRGSPTPSAASDENEEGGRHSFNPRKRKHRESATFKASSMEPPRRRPRNDNDSEIRVGNHRSSAERSPSPKLRRHRRTASSQSTWTEGGGEGSSGRKRRAATQLPVQEMRKKANKHTWDSDASSEGSNQLNQNRLSRVNNRSVSTPGRTMGRDHKRHVNKYGFTRLAEACESGDLDLVKEWREKDPEQLQQREFAGNTPLQVASLNGYPEIVEYLLSQGCDPHVANTDKDTPLIDAVENGHIEVVRLLLKAGVDPLKQNLKGQQAMDVITDETENAKEIRCVVREAIERWKENGYADKPRASEEPEFRPGPTKGLQFMARTPDNLLKLVSNNDRTGVQEFLDARVQVNNDIVAAAAKTGDLYLLNMLLAEMSPKARRGAEKPMLAVIGTSHFEMVKALTEIDQFNPVWKSKTTGLTWYELAEERQGPNWEQEKELLKRLYDAHDQRRGSSSPVTKRENGKKRHRSPVRRAASDIDMEDAEAREQGRSRRRLMSKKDMRAASIRRSSSASSARSDDVPPIRITRARDSLTRSPEAPRKVGRPRTTSISSPPKQRENKRRHSESMREKQESEDRLAEERAKAAAKEKAAREAEDQAIKQEAERKAADAAEAEERARKQAEIDAKAEAEKKAEEARKAEEEQARREEEARRREEERQAEEARLEREKREMGERRARSEEMVNALPSALRHVLGLSNSMESKDQQRKKKYIQQHFLPVQAVTQAALGHETEKSGSSEQLWMLNYQAAGILGGTAAAELLHLPADPAAQRSALSEAETLPADASHLHAMLPCIQSASLVHDLDESDADSDDPVQLFLMADRARRKISEDKNKFLHMSTMSWIKLSELHKAIESDEFPHLHDLALEVRRDCCPDAQVAAKDKAATNGAADHEAEDGEQLAEGKLVVNGSRKEGSALAGLGLTKVKVLYG